MRATIEQAKQLTPLVKIVWPEHEETELQRIIMEYITAESSAVFAEQQGEEFVGIALCCLRHDYVEGCETSPVGYLEGVAVKETCRKQSVAKRLVAQCEQWAREKGCSEFASDCELCNTSSLCFHLSIGFEEQNRIICFKKKL